MDQGSSSHGERESQKVHLSYSCPTGHDPNRVRSLSACLCELMHSLCILTQSTRVVNVYVAFSFVLKFVAPLHVQHLASELS